MDPSLRQPDAPAAGAVAAEQNAAVEEEPPSQWRLTLDLVEDDGDWRAFDDIEALVEAARRVLIDAPELASAEPGAATIALSSDTGVRQLNATYRGKDKPTNVLSFPAPALPQYAQPPNGPRPLGDVVLAAETVLSEAAAAGIPPAHHFQHLLIHGLLHLLGYDHESDADAETMEALETTLLARLSITDPYASGAADTAPAASHPTPKLHQP